MPLILGAAESGNLHQSGERAPFLRRSLNPNVHAVCILLIPVHRHHRPFSIGTLHRIRRHQFMARAVLYVALRGKHLMLRRPGLHPIQVD
jgi:hypothetical protein